MNFAQTLADQFSLQTWQTEKVIELIDEGNTIPFIARYRKEAHGSLDDQTLREAPPSDNLLCPFDKHRCQNVLYYCHSDLSRGFEKEAQQEL